MKLLDITRDSFTPHKKTFAIIQLVPRQLKSGHFMVVKRFALLPQAVKLEYENNPVFIFPFGVLL
tara:strand:- start:1009 stop:1203 length:195 start_codon:yes stop_codon:yes gene_type:complete